MIYSWVGQEYSDLILTLCQVFSTSSFQAGSNALYEPRIFSYTLIEGDLVPEARKVIFSWTAEGLKTFLFTG